MTVKTIAIVERATMPPASALLLINVAASRRRAARSESDRSIDHFETRILVRPPKPRPAVLDKVTCPTETLEIGRAAERARRARQEVQAIDRRRRRV